ncbi:JmjC domain-containing protein [Tateyamaria sp. SN6-1]|uniref:JmjC domain-containing protein n=1 Tax=Tateyamaria sp. SN6-1 TaxID=3092148 RepID=UPI0039F544AB
MFDHEPQQPGWSLETLITPVSAQGFFDRYHERDFLYSPGHAGRSLETLFQVSALEDLMCQMQDLDDVKTTGGRAGSPAPARRGAAGGYFADYADGKTIVVNGIHRRWAPVRDLCAALAADMVTTLQCNLYVTPAGAQGLDCHWDGHDVLVLQVGGSKAWTLYPMIDNMPAPDAPGQGITPDAPPLAELTLRAGDVLYVPRGMPHVAQATDETSAHLTIGLIGVTWRDLMQAAVHVAAQTRTDMRRVLPVGWVSGDIAAPEAYAAAAQVLADRDVLHRAVDLLAAKVIEAAPVPVRDPFASLDLVDAMTLETELSRPARSLVRCIANETGATLHFPGGQIDGTDKTLWAFGFFAETARFRIRDIPGWYSDAERMKLARDLVCAGLYAITPGSPLAMDACATPGERT